MIMVSMVVAASLHSMFAVACAQSVSGALVYFVNAHYTKRLLGYGMREQFADLLPYILITAPMLGALWLVCQFVLLQPPVKLALLTGLGAVLYLTASWHAKVPAMQDMVTTLGRLRRPTASRSEA
jgi:hypothetical protein